MTHQRPHQKAEIKSGVKICVSQFLHFIAKQVSVKDQIIKSERHTAVKRGSNLAPLVELIANN